MSDLVERLLRWEERTYGPFGRQVRVSEETLTEAAARITELETALAEAVAYMWTDPTHQRPPELHWHYDTGPAYEGWIITPLCAAADAELLDRMGNGKEGV